MWFLGRGGEEVDSGQLNRSNTPMVEGGERLVRAQNRDILIINVIHTHTQTHRNIPNTPTDFSCGAFS